MSEQTRLSVNINEECAEALRELTTSKGISVTEAIRRAVSVYKFFEDEQAAGNIIQTVDRRGRPQADIVLP